MDIMWFLFVEVKIQQADMVLLSFFKNFYVTLFEYKGPWMLKTDSLIF